MVCGEGMHLKLEIIQRSHHIRSVNLMFMLGLKILAQVTK